MSRWTWLLVALALPVLILVKGVGAGLAKTAVSPPGDVIINEWSQGNEGNKEWVELLAANGPLDLRGWDLGDSEPGVITFSNDLFWSNVPAGALIVIYNESDPDDDLPPDDADWGDCVVVLPDTSPLLDGALPPFSNSNDEDNPHLRDAAQATIHDFTADPGSDLHPDAGENAQYNGDTAGGISDPALWSNELASGATPGAGNGAANSAWIASLCGDQATTADLSLAKSGPASALISETLTYQITLQNSGAHTATAVTLTDTLPLALDYAGDDSGWPLAQPDPHDPHTLAWTVGDLPGDTAVSFHLTTTIAVTESTTITNRVRASTTYSDANPDNDEATAVTRIGDGRSPQIVIDALYYDAYESGEPDEAIALRNVGAVAADLGGWMIGDGSGDTAVLSPTTLLPGRAIWLASDEATFTRQFGHPPDLILSDWPGFANTGDEALLYDAEGTPVDVLVYEEGDTAISGWVGAALQPYTAGGLFAAEGQILYRRRDPRTGQPVPDSDAAADWAQSRDDVYDGRKTRYPGWDLDQFFFPAQMTETAVLTVAIAPDNAFTAVNEALKSANDRIQIETHTFENLALAETLIEAAGRGVSVTVLLEGGPPGGLPDQERYVCQQLAAAGGACWFMVNRLDDSAVPDRYKFMHAKFILIDGELAIVGSENLSPRSLPYDDKSDGTWGRRGVVLLTDAPGVVAHLEAIFAADFDPAHHDDLFPWRPDHETYGPPPPGFRPITVTGGVTYPVRYPQPLSISGAIPFQIVQSPENALRTEDGLLGLLAGAGSGDTIWVQQLGERPYWGPSDSNPAQDPNPRLEAYLAAAQRGATVRVLLDAYFDDPAAPTGNSATCRALNEQARQGDLDLRCRIGNPTGLGIHNKMVLAEIDGRGYVHVGSINGTEQANKGNREVALQFQSDAAYALLAQMVWADWPHAVYLPLLMGDYIAPSGYPLISELLYDPAGLDEDEFIEIVNPTNGVIDLGQYTLGDAVSPTDFEDVRRFPPGTLLPPGQTVVVATTATAFATAFGDDPDFEITDSDTAVPDLIDDPNWGDPDAFLQLGNQGDEVLLRTLDGQIVDVVAYGAGHYPGVVTCPLVSSFNHSLERYPYWRDTGDCSEDFRDWPFPNPGLLP